jgi:hypothetical protein
MFALPLSEPVLILYIHHPLSSIARGTEFTEKVIFLFAAETPANRYEQNLRVNGYHSKYGYINTIYKALKLRLKEEISTHPEGITLKSFRFLSEKIYKNLCELCVSNEA